VSAGETPEGEPVELPDLRLGRAILENCKACAEQGNVREEMRKKEGFFAQMFKVPPPPFVLIGHAASFTPY
jgi:hypothetical protein